jgi:acyl carrier protein
MDVKADLLSLLDEALHLEGRSSSFDERTPLLGALPELDSMGVVALLTAFEDRLGLAVDDDEIDGSVFQTFGSLLAFVQTKLGTGSAETGSAEAIS